MKRKLLIIGGGNMGYALAKGIIKKHLYSTSDLILIEKEHERIIFLKSKKNQVSNFENIVEILKEYKNNLDAIIIAVKPCDVKETIVKIKDFISSNTLIISIAAGINIRRLTAWFQKNQPISRVMPNTPCQITEGMSVITFNKYVTNSKKNVALSIFQAVGKVIELHENKFDLIAAISGSGPAYFCYLIESLIEGAKKLKLNRNTTKELVLQTAYGTILLLHKHNISPEALRKAVTSKKGTTAAAIKIFQKHNFNKTIYKAISAAKNRAKELSTIFLLCFTSCFFLPPVISQEPILLSTETEDIALTDDVNIARAQVAKYPENPEAHFNLAIALSRTSLVEEAIKELRKTKILIRKPENKGTIEKKIIEYSEILKNNPTANNIRYRLAFSHYLRAYYLTKEIEKAKSALGEKSKNQSGLDLFASKAVLLNAKNPEIKESLNQSVYYFNELLKINPSDNWTKVYLAFILVEQFSEISKAKELWQEVLNQEPNNPAPHFFLGELHIKEGRLKEGLTEISKAILLRSLGN